jgi:molybdate transport system ATP-binding protein
MGEAPMSLSLSIQLQQSNFKLDIDVHLKSKGITAVYGHSGAGKTSLLRTLAGLEKNALGSVKFNNEIWQQENIFLATDKRQIAYVFQDARLFPFLTVKENLHYAFKRRFNTNGPSLRQVSEWFELNALLSQNANTLSAGQAQRVALARALLSSPQLILMDEPLGSLDAQSKESILLLLETLHQHISAPVIYVSHSIEEVCRLASELLLLENGQVIAQGSLIELCARLDLKLNHEENAAALIHAIVKQHDEHYGLTELSIPDSGSLFLTQTSAPTGKVLRVRIPARDVSISLVVPAQSSILNILPCTINAIEKTSASRVLIRLQIGEQYLLARLTNKSVDKLSLHTGQQVYAQIKTVALLTDTFYNHE